MGTGAHGADRDAESFHDALLIRGDDKRALPGEEDDHGGEGDVSEAARGHQILELRLGLLEGILKRATLLTPRIFGVPNHVRYVSDDGSEETLSASP